jgi:hypothetical protein
MGGVRGGRKPLSKRYRKNYFRTLVSENVQIALKSSLYFTRDSKPNLFVQCNQLECQYVALHQSPCTLRLDLFAEEIEKRGGKNTGIEVWKSETNPSVVFKSIGT